MSPEQQLELYRRFLNGDNDALGELYLRYWPPQDHEGEHLVDWAMRKFELMEYDAEDAVAEWWAELVEDKPEINRNFRAYMYQGIRWWISNLFRKRNPGENPRDKPWVAKTNQFHLPAAAANPKVIEAEETTSIREGYSKAAHIAHFTNLALLQKGLPLMEPDEQRAIQLYCLENLTIAKTAKAMGLSDWKFRQLLKKAKASLKNIILALKNKIETVADEEELLSQWGNIRPDLHWVPNEKYAECDCSKCEKERRRVAASRGISYIEKKPIILVESDACMDFIVQLLKRPIKENNGAGIVSAV